MAMDPIHRRVLANKTSVIMERITNPVILSGYLKIVFSSTDEEEIKAKTTQMGPTIGTQTLLSLLEKRGHNAFPLFISVLRNHELKQEELATELEEEERRLRGKAEVPMRRVQSLPSCNDGEPEDNDHVELPPPPPYSELAPAGSGNQRYNYNQEQLQSPLGKQPSVMEMSNQAHPAQEQTQVTPDSLVKDIPYRLRMRIELMMNHHDVNNHDWKGLAGAMNMTADEVRQMEEGEKGKMAGLFDKMIHTKKTINDLLALLKHGDVQRLDVIDEIVKECDLPKEKLQMESSEDLETESAAVASSVEETSNPATKCKSLPFPRQESKEPQELDAKPDARNPSQVEDDDDPKGAAQLDTKPDARIPSQVENDDPKGAAQLDTKPDARVPSQVEGDEDPKGAAQLDTKPDARIPSQVEDSEELEFNSRSNASQVNKRIGHAISTDDDDDVFDSTGDNKVKKHALLISCCRNSKSDKMHDEKLRELAEMLEDSGWEVEGCYCKCKVANLLQNVHKSLCGGESGRTISFVYLVGPTVHINGENYLLPADLKSPSSRADLIHSSLNINWLVSQLSRNYMQVVIVDGAFENALTDVSFSGVLQGLAPIHPPPNAAIAFPCLPGTIRPEQERLDYIESVLNNLQNVMLPDMFDKVRAELREKRPEAFSLPVEFSLSSSLLPLCLSPGDNEGLQVPCFSNATCHAIIVSNSKYKHGLSIDTNQCLKDCERLRMALLKGQWECSEICNKTAKGIIDELGQTLNRLSADKKKKVVMVYFMGCTQMRLDCNYFFGKDFTVGSPDPLRSSVPLKWVLDLMCEKIKGPKILIVDDLSTNTTEGLVPMTAPLDVMISLPKGGDSRQYDTSFTSNFAELLKTKAGQLSLKEMIKKAASFDRHHLSSSLYLN